jgi:hypothetical protein
MFYKLRGIDKWLSTIATVNGDVGTGGRVGPIHVAVLGNDQKMEGEWGD